MTHQQRLVSLPFFCTQEHSTSLNHMDNKLPLYLESKDSHEPQLSWVDSKDQSHIWQQNNGHLLPDAVKEV